MSNPLIGVFALFAILLMYYVGFRMFQIQKRKKEKTFTDPIRLVPRKITYNFSLNGNFSGKSWEKLVSKFRKMDSRFVHGKAGTEIVYLGDSGKSKFDGMLSTPAEAMPVRILFVPKEDKTEVRMDEDFGFQMFLGPAKSAFQEKYETRFEMLENSIREELEN
ncbi:hypothetical protein N9933_02910 [bacterium]|nr:hypothetical protein [bacterium]